MRKRASQNSDSKSRASRQKAERKVKEGKSGRVKKKLYIQHVMAETMLAATANSTSMYFGFNHMSHMQNLLFTMEHVERCNEITGIMNILWLPSN